MHTTNAIALKYYDIFVMTLQPKNYENKYKNTLRTTNNDRNCKF